MEEKAERQGLQWDDVRIDLGHIVDVVESVPERYREKCFELLLQYCLGESRRPYPLSKSPTGSDVESRFESVKYQNFIKRAGIEESDIDLVLDLDSGSILVREIGDQRAEKQRKLAALIAIRHCAFNGEFSIPKKELVEKCKKFNAYDSANFARNMKSFAMKGSRVFIADEEGWYVSAPGEAFLVDILKELVAHVKQA